MNSLTAVSTVNNAGSAAAPASTPVASAAPASVVAQQPMTGAAAAGALQAQFNANVQNGVQRMVSSVAGNTAAAQKPPVVVTGRFGALVADSKDAQPLVDQIFQKVEGMVKTVEVDIQKGLKAAQGSKSLYKTPFEIGETAIYRAKEYDELQQICISQYAGIVMQRLREGNSQIFSAEDSTLLQALATRSLERLYYHDNDFGKQQIYLHAALQPAYEREQVVAAQILGPQAVAAAKK